MDRGGYGAGPMAAGPPRCRPAEQKRSGTWMLGPIIAAIALIAVGALVVVTQTGS